jgi:hypothetical protein
MNTAPRSLLFGVSVVVVIASVVAGLLVLGPPEDERSRRLDNRRVADLHRISMATDLYWNRNSRLPESLEELAAESRGTINSSDPVRPEAYGYQPLDSTRYEVCAHFDRESVGPVLEGMPIRQITQGVATPDLWKHGPGRQCFQLDAG